MEKEMRPESLAVNGEKDNENDDFLVLSHLFSLPELNYIDIARKEKIPQVLTRWPLLAELSQSAQNKSDQPLTPNQG
ncbi:hypothetical protein ACVWV0_000104 [Ewingella americana]